jgi:hypothetical protein
MPVVALYSVSWAGGLPAPLPVDTLEPPPIQVLGLVRPADQWAQKWAEGGRVDKDHADVCP